MEIHAEQDQTLWLLEKENPSVRYWALCDLLGRKEQDQEVINAQE